MSIFASIDFLAGYTTAEFLDFINGIIEAFVITAGNYKPCGVKISGFLLLSKKMRELILSITYKSLNTENHG